MNKENRGGYIVSEDMKKVWRIQLDLAMKLLDVCQRHNLKIWAYGGTLLGLIRHQGYIPWDDDMDFIMLREDYDKLIKLTHEFEHPYFLQSALSDPTYTRGHAQLRNTETTAILKHDIWQNFNQGIFIDIFINDDMPDDEKEWEKPLKVIDERQRAMTFRNYASFYADSFGDFKALIASCLFFRNKSMRNYFLETEKIVREFSYSKNHRIGFPMFIARPKALLKEYRIWYNETIYLPFEDIMMPAPAMYHEILSSNYGQDYMTPRQSPSNHGNVIFDTERSYSEVIKELRSALSFKEKLKGWLMPPKKK